VIDPANAQELAEIAREVGADVFKGALRYPSDTGGWLVGDLDFCEYLDRYRDQEVILIIAPVGVATTPTYTCGICGFVMNEVGECPRCKLMVEGVREEVDGGGEDFLQEVREIVERIDREQRSS